MREKERKLAIKMWKHIKRVLANDPEVNIVRLKREFCTEHELSWDNCCWFCEYMPNCVVCPLHGCTDYGNVLDERKPLEIRLNACDVILDALRSSHV